MVKLISAILYAENIGDNNVKSSDRTALAGKIADALHSQYLVQSRTQVEPIQYQADKNKEDTAVVRLNKEEMSTIMIALELRPDRKHWSELGTFFNGVLNGLQKKRDKEIDKQMAQRGADYCEPGVNCE
tara:strand:+ start:729 stop:1115 length:387 start_codon:yes stop_codon:yes gene_type:complete